jgi:hypothetical protein
MRTSLLLLICLCTGVTTIRAQESMRASMEKRARELHRVLCLDDKEQWKKFMKENYSKDFLARPVKATIETQGKEGGQAEKTTTTADNLEQKAQMFERLHKDFGTSKIISLKPDGEKVDMILENTAGLKGNFEIKFEKDKPYLIDGVGIRVNH